MPFDLDETKFASNVRSARRGAAAGPSGMTVEHVRLVLDNVRDAHLLFSMAEQLSRAHVPLSVTDALRLGRMTALQKPSGGVRGIVAGDVLRRLVAKTVAQQMGKAVEAATRPHQYAMSTRAGTERIAHVLQVLAEVDPRFTAVSIDCVGAYDSISRKAMLEALTRVPGGPEVLPFVRLFYGQPSQYAWEDDEGVVHRIRQGEGREQGDSLMPLLLSLGQHAALDAVKARMVEGEVLLAFLDDVCVIIGPDRVGDVYLALQEELCRRARIRIHAGKTQVWNAAGERPEACDILERIAQAEDPRARVWKGSNISTSEQGVHLLGTPLGHVDYVQTQLTQKLAEHNVFLQRIPLVADVQSAWSLLLHCAGERANDLLRVVRPELVGKFALGHSEGLWECLKRIMKLEGDVSDTVKDITSLPLALGGLGLRSAIRTSESAFWASWADSHDPRTTPHRSLCNRGKSGTECGHDTNVGLSCACSPPLLWGRRF